ncbi:helix-turn-helix domain-containing protein [Streptomyces sp. NPDC020801]|uniref:helix-turn-helix domain-containing protein n=1 Tax=Streptomyces sp. NPDC020801 TaxID=3365093 RepID=UPI0037B7DB51
MKPTRRPFTPFKGGERIAAREKAVEQYGAGHTIRCVAALIDRSWTTTRDLLAEADVTFRPRGTQCTANH